MTRIAMWSGPRNLSTALMYSFAARDDCTVWDEPFYAAYLAKTGADHPMRTDIISAYNSDAKQISDACRGAVPNGANLWYQKHMCQHMVPGIERGFMVDCVNVFLIRHPARVIASYHAKNDNPDLHDIGLNQQLALFKQVADHTGSAPIVINSSDIRANPEMMLRTLCDTVGISFQTAMLGWPKGGHAQDGIWAKHWYGSVWASSGFAGPEAPLPTLPDHLQPVLDAAIPIYEALAQHAISPGGCSAPPTASTEVR